MKRIMTICKMGKLPKKETQTRELILLDGTSNKIDFSKRGK